MQMPLGNLDNLPVSTTTATALIKEKPERGTVNQILVSGLFHFQNKNNNLQN